MTEIEYGIKHVRTNEVHIVGMTKEQAEEWIKEWNSDGGRPGAFVIIYREILLWKELKE